MQSRVLDDAKSSPEKIRSTLSLDRANPSTNMTMQSGGRRLVQTLGQR